MNIFRYGKNSIKFLNTIKDIVSEYEKDTFISCLNEIMEEAKRYVADSKQEIAEWKDFNTDYVYKAHQFIINMCYGVKNSSSYQIKLNSRTYDMILSRALAWAKEHHYL